MSNVASSYSNGVDRSNDELRLGEGFMRVCENAIYVADDPDRLWKIPGRTQAGLLTGARATNPIGLAHFQFDSADNQLVLQANSQLYRQNASTFLPFGGWTSVNDLQSPTPQPFPRTGSYIKAVPDALNRWITFDGSGQRPLIHDEDGNTRYLSLKKPSPPVVSTINTAPTVIRPTSSTNPSGFLLIGSQSFTVTGVGFQNNDVNDSTATNAYDGDFTTSASTTIATNGTGPSSIVNHATSFAFSAGGTTSNSALILYLSASTTIPPYTADPHHPHAPPPPAPNHHLLVAYSINGGTTWTDAILTEQAPFGPDYFVFDLPDGITWANLRVLVLAYSLGGTGTTHFNATEIFAQGRADGRSTVLLDGTYYYAVTEVYKVNELDGTSYEVESAPSDVASFTITNNLLVRGATLLLPARTNLDSDGVTHDPLGDGATASAKFLTRRIYRSTRSGVWPDLGKIAEVPIATTSYTDTFLAVDEITLGAPGIFTGFAGSVVVQVAGQAPAIYDAAVTSGGLIVVIPVADRHTIQWCMPGQPDYWPENAHNLGLLPSLRNDNLQGIVSVGDAILIFLRTRVLRIIGLPIVNQPNYDITQIKIDLLSPNEGLAGTPLSYCAFESQKGRSVVAWVSDNGIWMTDGTLLSERGLGVAKLSINMDWEGDVDKTRLDETQLHFDPTLQLVHFDFYDQAGNSKTYIMHVHPDHWVDTGQDQAVPKITGPHPSRLISRIIAEREGGGFDHWSLSASSSKIYNERTGTDDDGQPILTHIEDGWRYWAGPMEELHVYFAGVYHNDWGKDEACDLEMLFRRDKTGIIQTVKKRVLLNGTRVTRVWVDRGGQSVKTILRHNGPTVSSGAGMKAFGPIAFEVSDMTEVEKD